MMAMRAGHTMHLSDLLGSLAPSRMRLATNPAVTGLALDSRRIVAGDCFIALAGTREHGIRHAAAAVAAGAVAVLTEDLDILPALGVPVVRVDGLRGHVGDIAARFHGHPARGMQVIAVTGTNGKTTVAHLCADALQRLHGTSAYFGTLGSGFFDALAPTLNTTPDPLSLQCELARLFARGCRHVALEASSHALEQGRLNGLEIGVAIFTGLGHDHLDYHRTLANYGAAKARLFSHVGLHTAVINAADEYAQTIARAVTPGVRTWRYSARRDGPPAEVTTVEAESTATGSRLRVRTPVGDVDISSALIGDFNLENLLAALAGLLAIGTPAVVAAAALSAARPVRGRLELAARQPCVYVDYAHGPDSLERVLAALRRLCHERLICVFGCGGDRDASKRPLMGEVAERGADVVFVTSDNPRSENPAAIAAAIVGGMRQPECARVVLDRRAAIRDALQLASARDIVLVAGKGHETTQATGDSVTPFDDVRVVRECLGLPT